MGQVMQITVTADVKKARRQLDLIERKQIPYAASLALNDVAFASRKAEIALQANVIDNPTPFTKRGFKVHKSNKRDLEAVLEIPPAQWKYLRHQVRGGASVRNHAIPVNHSLENKYGGLPRRKAITLAKRKNHFSATLNGTAGVWKRESDGSLSLQILFKPKTTQRKKYPFGKATKRLVAARWSSTFDKRLRAILIRERAR
tara:strand:- start:216 stop:818 length:603 start_codon:yes stop_codon:yes gene_type:complete